MSVILAYIPVLHEGYHRLFSKHSNAKRLYVLTKEVASEFTPVHKEIRALDVELIIKAIQSWKIFDVVVIADQAELAVLSQTKEEIIIPDEVVTVEVTRQYLPNCPIKKSSIFLRWDKKSASEEKEIVADETITSDEVAQMLMQQATAEGQKSSDWWRRVGAVAVRAGKVLAQAHNTHLPSEQQQYAEGDSRAHFHKGDHIELTTAIHAEAKLIAEAAATGVSLKDVELFVTDFPCPPCAKLIAHAGIKKLYFSKGYAMLDGERVLRSKNIEIIRVK